MQDARPCNCQRTRTQEVAPPRQQIPFKCQVWRLGSGLGSTLLGKSAPSLYCVLPWLWCSRIVSIPLYVPNELWHCLWHILCP